MHSGLKIERKGDKIMDFASTRGDSIFIQFDIDSDIVLDLSSNDFEITFSLKQSATDSAYVFQKDKTAVTQLAENSFVLRIAPEDTVDLFPGYYYYDIQLNIGDDVFTIALGQLQLVRDITRPPVVLPTFIYPDVNGDGIVDTSDAVLVMQAYANIQAGQPSGLTEEQENLADCDRNGIIDSTDAMLISSFYSACQGGTYTNNSAGWTEYMNARYGAQ